MVLGSHSLRCAEPLSKGCALQALLAKVDFVGSVERNKAVTLQKLTKKLFMCKEKKFGLALEMRWWSGGTAGRLKVGINREVRGWVLHRGMSYILKNQQGED